jgi:hypothetical protein
MGKFTKKSRTLGHRSIPSWRRNNRRWQRIQRTVSNQKAAADDTAKSGNDQPGRGSRSNRARSRRLAGQTPAGRTGGQPGDLSGARGEADWAPGSARAVGGRERRGQVLALCGHGLEESWGERDLARLRCWVGRLARSKRGGLAPHASARLFPSFGSPPPCVRSLRRSARQWSRT